MVRSRPGSFWGWGFRDTGDAGGVGTVPGDDEDRGGAGDGPGGTAGRGVSGVHPRSHVAGDSRVGEDEDRTQGRREPHPPSRRDPSLVPEPRILSLRSWDLDPPVSGFPELLWTQLDKDSGRSPKSLVKSKVSAEGGREVR